MAEFTHLHLHTDYSLLDGACDVEKLVAHVDSIGQKAVAITDHGNIYGEVHFFEAAKAKGVKRPAPNNCPLPFNNPLLFVIPTGANPDFLPRSTGQGRVCAFR
jgi:PHP domain